MPIPTGSVFARVSDVGTRTAAAPDAPSHPAGVRRGWSLRAYAHVLILAVVLPLGALLYAALRQMADDDEAYAAVSAQRQAHLFALQTDLVLAEARGALEAMAARVGNRLPEGIRCEAPIPDGFGPLVADIVITDPEGRPACAAGSAPAPDPDSVHQALAVNGFAVGTPRPAARRAGTVIPLALSLRRPDGAGIGAVTATLDVDRLKPPGDMGGLGTASALVLLGVGAEPIAEGPSATPLNVSPDLRSAVVRHGDGLHHELDAEGNERLIGFARLSRAPWTAIASVAHPATFAGGKRVAWFDAVGIALVLAMALLAAAALSRRMLQPFKAIRSVARAVAHGDVAARAPLDGPRELRDIAAGINVMLDERQRDEGALRESEARFRQLFETSNDAIVIVDQDNRIVFANAAIERVFGHAPTALAGRELSMLQPERFREPHRQGMRRFLASGERRVDWRGTEAIGLHADGRQLPIEIAFSYLRVGGADVFAAFVRDISRRKRAEAELRESEARFRVLADSAPSLIWMAAADGSCTYVNRPWLTFTGRSLDETCGTGWTAPIHPEDRPGVLERSDDAFERREPVTLEYRLRRHDGEYRWMLNQGTPRCDEDGALIGYVGTCVDIHDRVMAERRIRRLSTLYAALSKANEAMARTRGTSALLQQVCDIAVAHGGFHLATVGLIDEAAHCARTVAAAGETYGFLDHVVLGLGDDDPRREAPSRIAMRENRPYISNDREHDARTPPLPHPAARAAVKSTAAFPLHQEGRVIGFLTVHATEMDYFDAEMTDLLQLLATDLSFALDTMASNARREQAEGALRQLNATLEQKVEERTLSLQAANRELEAFGYSVSHDLRAPLRAIGGFTELIVESHQDRLDHEARGYLERVRAAAQRMSRLIDDLMNLSRVARQPLAREPLDVSRLAAEVVAELQENDPQRAVQVRITPALTAHADRGLAQIVLANLLGNAWKFTAKRTGPAISVGLTERAGRRMYFVRDNGAGFDMQHADKLFAPFQRLHAEQEFAGTGIGLALVQRIVQRHGGSVEVESLEGQGTTIYFSLGPDAPT